MGCLSGAVERPLFACTSMLNCACVLQVPNSFVRVRSWGAAEQWLTQAEFFSMLSSVPYSPMIGCETWKVCGPAPCAVLSVSGAKPCRSRRAADNPALLVWC